MKCFVVFTLILNSVDSSTTDKIYWLNRLKTFCAGALVEFKFTLLMKAGIPNLCLSIYYY